MGAAEKLRRRQVTACVALSTAACLALFACGAVHPLIPGLCLLGLAFKTFVLDKNGTQMPLWALTPLHAFLVGAFVWFSMLQRPPMDFLQALLTFAGPLLLFRSAHRPTPFNGFLVFLISLLLVVACAAVTTGLMPILITGVYMLVACQAVPVLAARPPGSKSGVRVRVVARKAGRWRGAPAWVAHHLALVGLLLGGGLYLFVPRLAGEEPEVLPDTGLADQPARTRSGRTGSGRTSTQQTGFPNEVRIGDIGEIKRKPYVIFKAKLLAYGQPYDARPGQSGMMLLRARAWHTYDPASRRWRKPRRRRRALARTGIVDRSIGQTPLHWDITFVQDEDGRVGYDARNLFLPQRTKRVQSIVRPLYVDRMGLVSADRTVPRYQVGAAFPVDRGEPFARLTPEVPDPRLLAVPASLQQDLLRYMPKPANGSLYATVDAIKTMFRRHYAYTLTLPGALPDDRDPIIAFLERKEGHCELFASAACLFLRLAGFPARLAGGIRCHEKLAGKGEYQARLQNAHAWVEVHTREAGYVAIDFTPPDSAARAATGGLRPGDEETGAPADQSVDGFDWSNPFEYGPEDRREVVDWVGSRALATPTLVTLALLCLAGMAWGAAAAMRRKRAADPLRITVPRGTSRKTLAFYALWLRACAAQGHVRRRAQTPREFLARLPEPLRAEGRKITAEFERKRYG